MVLDARTQKFHSNSTDNYAPELSITKNLVKRFRIAFKNEKTKFFFESWDLENFCTKSPWGYRGHSLGVFEVISGPFNEIFGDRTFECTFLCDFEWQIPHSGSRTMFFWLNESCVLVCKVGCKNSDFNSR